MKDNTIVNKQFVAGVALTLMLCIALLMPSGVSQVVGATLPAQPKFLEVSKPKTLKLSEPKKFLEVSKPKSTKVSKPKSFKSGTLKEGKYTRAERENAEYLRCAAQKGFDDRHKCAFEAIGR